MEKPDVITGKVVQDTSVVLEEEITQETAEETEEKKEDETEEQILEKTETASPKQHYIYVLDKGFEPENLTIRKGDNVSWKNEWYRGMILLIFKDEEQYTHQTINPKESFVQVFDEEGLYDIYWNIANGPVTGRLNVKDEDYVYETVEESVEIKDIEKKKDEYNADYLIEDLKDILKADYYNFSRDKSYPKYIRSSNLKYYTIHTSDEGMDDAKEFCDKYCAANWEDWRYFINSSNLRYLAPVLGKENFSTESEYKRYRTEANLINHTFIETSYDVENGKVLEYQFISWEQDQFGYFEGGWFGTYLIYKVYCSPNMTVFLRPKWDEFNNLFLPAMTMSDTSKTWNNYIKSIREELLDQASEILDRCPVEKDFFQDYSFPDYYATEMLSYHWKVDLKNYWNLTRSLDIRVEPSNEEGKYLLKEINVSFRNDDEYDLDWDLGLRITVNPDNKGEEEYHDGGAGGKLTTGKSVERSMRKKDIGFSNNITIEAKLYTLEGKADIRPIKITYTKVDLGFG